MLRSTEGEYAAVEGIRQSKSRNKERIKAIKKEHDLDEFVDSSEVSCNENRCTGMKTGNQKNI